VIIRVTKIYLISCKLYKIMPWSQVTVDTLVDVKGENRKTIGDLLETFDKIMCILNKIKSETIKLDQCLQDLHLQSCNEGSLQEATVSFYNTALVNFGGTINTLLNMKLPSQSGLASKIIKKWTETEKHTNYKIAFKLSNYSWIPCSDACVVDNMVVTTEAVLCPELTGSPALPPNMVINIGCTEINIEQYVYPSGGADEDDWEEFKTLICKPSGFHQLISHINKNIDIIEKCINHINNLANLFELL